MPKAIIIAMAAILMSVAGLSANPSYAGGCDVIVTAPDSIQAVIDANPGDVVCLDDSGGDFAQQVVFDGADSGTTLMAEPGDSPVLDGTALVPPPATPLEKRAIELLGGVSDVTISGLEIRDFSGGFVDPDDDDSDAIHASDGATSNITVAHNYFHSNHGNGIRLFGGDGSIVHSNWKIESNFMTGNTNNGLALDGIVDSEIKDNYIHDNLGNSISVGARVRTSTGTATVSGVVIEGNDVGGPLGFGIRLRARADSAGGTALLTNSKVQDNRVDGRGDGITLEARGTGATLGQVEVKGNVLTNNARSGVRVTASDAGATVRQVKIKDNTVTGNEQNGVFLSSTGGAAIQDVLVSENALVGNLHHGLNVLASEGGSISQNTVSKNTVTGNTFLGIWNNANTSGVIADNQFEKNLVAGNSIHGIELSAQEGGAATGNRIEKNTVNGNAFTGVALQVIDDDGTVNGNIVQKNSATANVAAFGFFTNTGAGANTFEKNRSNLNGLSGFHDAAGAGHNNIYTNNQCNFNGSGGSFPIGLCSP